MAISSWSSQGGHPRVVIPGLYSRLGLYIELGCSSEVSLGLELSGTNEQASQKLGGDLIKRIRSWIQKNIGGDKIQIPQSLLSVIFLFSFVAIISICCQVGFFVCLFFGGFGFLEAETSMFLAILEIKM